eukprot:3740992-Pyramimonas_sp.AAC.1
MRTRFIRTSSQPWGVTDRSDFSARDHAALQRGNKLPRATLRIIRVLDFCQIPWFFGKPLQQHDVEYSCVAAAGSTRGRS